MRGKSSKTLKDRLKSKAFREAYVEGSVRATVPYQIRAMRQQRGWSQQELAERMDTSQSAVARLERPDNGKFNITTLLDAAAAFDVALLVKLIPFSQLLRERVDLSPCNVNAVEFSKDNLSVDPVLSIFYPSPTSTRDVIASVNLTSCVMISGPKQGGYFSLDIPEASLPTPKQTGISDSWYRSMRKPLHDDHPHPWSAEHLI